MRYGLTPAQHHVCDPESACQVPPSPRALAQLQARFLELRAARRLPTTLTFDQYYWVWRSGRRGESLVGLDDGAIAPGSGADRQLITRPRTPLKGVVRTIVGGVGVPPPHPPPNPRPRENDAQFLSTHTITPGRKRANKP
ncbi:hypothetical protein, partial [Actinokineospora sp.]|uniref:hypothetical protein n=1 Tax=Actinokineospora sp. TaxID=1872133 RepID=UPI0040381A3C